MKVHQIAFKPTFESLKHKYAVLVTPRFPARPDWRIRTGFRDARLRTGTLYLIFIFLFFYFLKQQNWYLWVWPTSYNRFKISYTFIESHLQYKTLLLQFRARNLHVVNPYKCVGPAVCGCLLMSSPVPTRIKNPC